MENKLILFVAVFFFVGILLAPILSEAQTVKKTAKIDKLKSAKVKLAKSKDKLKSKISSLGGKIKATISSPKASKGGRR